MIYGGYECKKRGFIEGTLASSYLYCSKCNEVLFHSHTGVACPVCGDRFFAEGDTRPPRTAPHATHGVLNGRLQIIKDEGCPVKYLFVDANGTYTLAPLKEIEKMLSRNGTGGAYDII